MPNGDNIEHGILITGVAGELGSSLAKALLKLGYDVSGIDIIPPEFAWRLKDIDLDNFDYKWMSTFDLTEWDLHGNEIIIQCDAQADRPLGISSPRFTLWHNIQSPIHLLELLARMPKNTFILYPGSGTIFLGVPESEQPITEETLPKPTNAYSWSKWGAEELYRTYGRQYNIPYVITRSGFVYGPGARLDISIMKWILRTLQGKDLYVRSPEATRTPAFVPNVLDAWMKLIKRIIDKPEEMNGKTINFVADQDYKMIDIANKVIEVLDGKNKAIPMEYESGESIDGKPVKQWEINVEARRVLGWEATTTLEDGIKQTAEWLKRSKWL